MALTKKSHDSHHYDLKGKNIIITGGTTGIGRATAVLLASMGANILIFGRGEPELKDALDYINKISDNVVGLTADVSKQDGVKKVFDMADQKLGNLHVLINNAGLGAGAITEMDYKHREYVVKTNLLGYLNCAREAVDRMKTKKEGHIILVGSMSADLREAGSSVYVATKSGIQGFSEALRKEINKLGIKVSLIEPGEVGTDMNSLSPKQQKEKQQRLKQLKAEDIADCIHYILTRPIGVDIVEMKVRPHLQII